MQRRLTIASLFWLVFGLCLLAAIAAISSGSVASPAAGRRIAVTSYPLFDIASHVAAGVAETIVVLPPGSNPHTFEPLPSSQRAVSSSSVVFAVGHGFDDWIDSLASSAAVPKVTVDLGIRLRPPTAPFRDAGQAEEDDGAEDPHYWLSIPNVKIIAATIAADLARRFPDAAGRIRTDLAAYVRTLDDADAKVRRILSGVRHRNIVTLHDAWYYFAEAYDLRIVGSFEPTAGREPTPNYLAKLGSAVRDSGTRTLYVEPLLPLTGLEEFLNDNGLATAEIDPIEGATPGGYAAIMIRNATIIRDHQR